MFFSAVSKPVSRSQLVSRLTACVGVVKRKMSARKVRTFQPCQSTPVQAATSLVIPSIKYVPLPGRRLLYALTVVKSWTGYRSFPAAVI